MQETILLKTKDFIVTKKGQYIKYKEPPLESASIDFKIGKNGLEVVAVGADIDYKLDEVIKIVEGIALSI
jgi:hypothetical protein